MLTVEGLQRFNIRVANNEEEQQRSSERELDRSGAGKKSSRSDQHRPHPTSLHIYNRGSQRGTGIYIGLAIVR